MFREIQDICNQSNQPKQKISSLCEYFLNADFGDLPNGSDLFSADDFSYQLDLFDCVTYVETILAFALCDASKSVSEFQKQFEENLKKIRYKDGYPSFINRNHFMSLDWLPNNSWMLQDITAKLIDNPEMATAQIDKSGWLKKHKNMSHFVAPDISIKEATVPYIKLTFVIDNYNQFCTMCPDFFIANIVRPNWDLVEQIGTHLNISHLGLAIKQADSTLRFFHSSIIPKKAVSIDLKDYLIQYLDSPTIKGINLCQVIL